jgi:hypothetical protein
MIRMSWHLGKGGLGNRWAIIPLQELSDPDLVVQKLVMTKE